VLGLLAWCKLMVATDNNQQLGFCTAMDLLVSVTQLLLLLLA
jgi:hypothetical protein